MRAARCDAAERTAPAPAARGGRACRSASAAAAPAPRAPTAPCSPAAAADSADRNAAGIQRRSRQPPPHSRPAAAAPAPSCRATTTACDTPACRSSTASISPGSIRNPRSFTCASARPRNSSTPSDRHRARSPVRYIRLAGRRAIRVGDKPLRRQTRPLQIAPRQSNPRDVQLADNTRRYRLKTRVQNIGPRSSRSGGRSGVRESSRRACRSWSHRPCLGRTVSIDHAAMFRQCAPVLEGMSSPATIKVRRGIVSDKFASSTGGNVAWVSISLDRSDSQEITNSLRAAGKTSVATTSMSLRSRNRGVKAWRCKLKNTIARCNCKRSIERRKIWNARRVLRRRPSVFRSSPRCRST